MHGSMLPEMRNGAAGSLPLADERMEQVRELLFGDYKRQCELQIAALEARLAESQAAMLRRVEDLEARLAHLAGETRNAQKSAFADLARSVADLGERIRTLS